MGIDVCEDEFDWESIEDVGLLLELLLVFVVDTSPIMLLIENFEHFLIGIFRLSIETLPKRRFRLSHTSLQLFLTFFK